jgi:NADH-quinone oxidoreductase subunit C
MSGEKDLEQLKREAAAKAKAAALAKKKTDDQKSDATDDLAKQKAAAAAKAKAVALAKKKADEQAETTSDDQAKAKAAAAAKAKAAALAKEKAQEQAGTDHSADGDAKSKAAAAAKAKAVAAAKAKAAATAKAKAAKEGSEVSQEKEEKPSPNQPLLEKYIKVIEEQLGKEVIEESYINRLSKDVPTLVIKKEAYYKVAEILKYNKQLDFDYLSELHGTDFETHMEVYIYLYSYRNTQELVVKVKLDRDQPKIDSVVSLWAGANWPECEAYDLLGIVFTGHPNLHRIMLGENWVGHPLRKDYVDDNELEV